MIETFLQFIGLALIWCLFGISTWLFGVFIEGPGTFDERMKLQNPDNIEVGYGVSVVLVTLFWPLVFVAYLLALICISFNSKKDKNASN